MAFTNQALYIVIGPPLEVQVDMHIRSMGPISEVTFFEVNFSY